MSSDYFQENETQTVLRTNRQQRQGGDIYSHRTMHILSGDSVTSGGGKSRPNKQQQQQQQQTFAVAQESEAAAASEWRNFGNGQNET
jgi:hypothetical protein